MFAEHTYENGVTGKICSFCDCWKPLSEYGPLKKGHAGLNAKCRACANAYQVAYRQTERGQEVTRRAQSKYYNTEKDLARRKRIHQTEKWKITNRRSVEAWQKRNPIKRKAARAVHYAVTKGELPPVTSCACADCDVQAEEYHHESYEKEHWLDVDPLCRRCHMVRHGRAA
jgi:hypothetical protein